MEITPETWNFIRNHQQDDIRLLALQAGKYPDVDMKAAINQIAGRRVISTKVPSWYDCETLLYPAHLSLEQCSSEVTARYKSRLCNGKTMADLTGGFGVDCAFMANSFSDVTYVERQSELCEIAKHNFTRLGLNHINVLNGDSLEFLRTMNPVDCLFIDPARRDQHGRKTVQLSDCEPNVASLEELLFEKASTVIVKLSPMLDISLALKELKYTTAVHILSVQNECKELLLVLSKSGSATVDIHCVNFSTNGEQFFRFNREAEQNCGCEYTSHVDAFLYEPNASILKAGAYKSIGTAFKLKKLHPNSHLYTSDELNENFPGRVFKVEQYSSVKDKSITRELVKANISVRNFPLSVDELRKKLKLKDGGENYLFATTLNDNSKVLIRCTKNTPQL